jgi:hypothetical protein
VLDKNKLVYDYRPINRVMIGLECIVVNLLDELEKPEVAGRVDPSQKAGSYPLSSVILSEAGASRSEDAAKSKDPAPACASDKPQREFAPCARLIGGELPEAPVVPSEKREILRLAVTFRGRKITPCSG